MAITQGSIQPKRNSTRLLRNRKQPVDLGQGLVEAFLTNERIGQLLIDLIDPKIWRVSPPCSKRRNIATTFAHIHNVRVMRLKMSSKGSKPARLNRADVTPAQAKRALAESALAIAALIEGALETGGHVPNYSPDVVAMVCAAITHEAHHRGQITHWARQLGAPISLEMQARLWDWNKQWKEVVGESR